jgi:hypothetical protein
MRNFITNTFRFIVSAWILSSLILGIAWLFDSQPENLKWVWMRLANLTAISFLFHLLFGANKN